MAKVASPDIQLELADNPLTLRFSAKALAALQDHWGLENLDQVSAKLAEMERGGLSIDDLAAILWATLRTHHPEYTKEAALDLLDDIGMVAFEATLVQAIAGAAPEGGGSAPANPPPAKKRPKPLRGR